MPVLGIESRPFFARIPDQAVIASGGGEGGLHLQATRDSDGSYAFVYFPASGQDADIDLSRLRPGTLNAWWYGPRTGVGTLIGNFDADAKKRFRSPPYGPDWVLVLDSANASFAPPGLQK